MSNLKAPSIVDAHGLDVIVGEVALGRLPLLAVEHKQVEAAHDPPHLVIITMIITMIIIVVITMIIIMIIIVVITMIIIMMIIVVITMIIIMMIIVIIITMIIMLASQS